MATKSLNDSKRDFWGGDGTEALADLERDFLLDNANVTVLELDGAGDFISAGLGTKPNGLYVAGVNIGVTVPDSADLDGIADLDIRVKVQTFSKTNAADRVLFGKTYSTSGGSWFFNLTGTAKLYFLMNDGATNQAGASVNDIPDTREPVWFRVTRTSADGVTTFYYALDDTLNWVQMGAPVVIHAGKTPVDNANSCVVFKNAILGHKCQVRNGINGALVLDIDFTNPAHGWEVGDTNGATGVDGTGKVISLSSGATRIVSTFDIIGDLDIRARLRVDDWTNAAVPGIVNKHGAWRLVLLADGRLQFNYWLAGVFTSLTSGFLPSSFIDGTTHEVRVTVDVNNGAGARVINFYYRQNSKDSWTLLSTNTIAPEIAFDQAANPLFVGARETGAGGGFLDGAFEYVEIRRGIDGTVVSRIDFTDQTIAAATVNDDQGNVYTPQGNAIIAMGVDDSLTSLRRKMYGATPDETTIEAKRRFLLDRVKANSLFINGAASGSMQANIADDPDFDITGDIDLRARIRTLSWTYAHQAIIAKWTTGQISYALRLDSTGNLSLFWSVDGNNLTSATSTANLLFRPLNEDTWVRATLDVNNGSGQREVKFYWSEDGEIWTQLGATVTVAVVTSIFSGTAPIRFGSLSSTQLFYGYIKEAQVFNGINGTKVIDVNFSKELAETTSFNDELENPVTMQGGAKIVGPISEKSSIQDLEYYYYSEA